MKSVRRKISNKPRYVRSMKKSKKSLRKAPRKQRKTYRKRKLLKKRMRGGAGMSANMVDKQQALAKLMDEKEALDVKITELNKIIINRVSQLQTCQQLKDQQTLDESSLKILEDQVQNINAQL